jgi:hypothetical protein
MMKKRREGGREEGRKEARKEGRKKGKKDVLVYQSVHAYCI